MDDVKTYALPKDYQDYTFHSLPKPVGYWVLYPQQGAQTKFAMYHKPTDEQIKNTEELLGWGWENV